MKISARSFLLLFAISFVGFSAVANDLNLDFEQVGYKGIPKGWYVGGGGRSDTDLAGYIGEVDSKITHSGKYSLHLKYIKGDAFGVGTSTLPVGPVRGKMIRYSGWIKTRNVGGTAKHNFNGYAGLWMRVDGPDHRTLAGNNMQDSLVNGTRDWEHFSFEVPVGEEATNINFGVITTGKGEAWFDGLTIDTNGVRFSGE